MNNSNALQTHSAAGTEVTVRQLSTEQRNAWIDRVFQKLTLIYGDTFTRNWNGIDAESVRETWADILAGFAAEDIGAAIKSCYSNPKPPNAPEFAALCRQHMNARSTHVEQSLTADERKAAAKIADKVATEFKAKDEAKGYMFNGVLITPYKQWAVDLMRREAAGESLPFISTTAWREVLQFDKETSAKEVADKLRSAA